MKTSLKMLAAAAAIAIAPVSASALTFGSDLAAGDTYNVTDGSQGLVAVAVNPEAAGNFSINVTNNAASTWTFSFGEIYLNNSFPGGSFSFEPGGVTATGPFSVALAAGQTYTLTVFYDALSAGDVLGARLNAVPLPAGIILLMSALGLTAVMRKRRTLTA